MATEGILTRIPGLVCGATTLIAKQFYAVKLHTDGTVIVASAQGERVTGILQNKPAVGEAAEVACAGVTKASADAAIAAGDFLTVQSDGQLMTAAGGDYIVGQALEAAAGAGSIFSMMIRQDGVL